MMQSAIADIVCAALFMALSLPLVYNKIPPNHFYGFRTRKSFASLEHWYRINQYGGWALILWSMPLLVTGLVKLALVRYSPSVEPGWWGVLPLIAFTMAALVQTLRYASRL